MRKYLDRAQTTFVVVWARCGSFVATVALVVVASNEVATLFDDVPACFVMHSHNNGT